MDFVTKKEFEDAVNMIERALRNKQLFHIQHECTPEELHTVNFSTNYHGGPQYGPSAVTFIAPQQAAKDQLVKLRVELKTKQDLLGKSQKEVEDLENKEKKLTNLLTLLKE